MIDLPLNIIERWQEMNAITAVFIFLVYVLLDGMYAYYTLAVSEKKPLRAATTGTLMHFLLAVGVLNYVQNYLYILPLALGSWVGTYFVVKRFEGV